MPGMNTLITLGIVALSVVFGIMGVFVAIKKFYHVASPDEALIKTGGKQPVVSVGGGLWVIPMFHKVARISTRAISITIDRTGVDAVPSSNMIPAEIQGEMKVQINPAAEADIILAAQSLGALEPQAMAARIKSEIDSLVTDALRTAAFKRTFIELNSEKKEFAGDILEMLDGDLKKFGLTLQAVAVTHVKQGKFMGGEGDIIDAEGMRNVAETVEKNRQETNLITRNAEVQVAKQDVDAKEQTLSEELRQTKLVADQEREVAEYQAQQSADTKTNVLAQEQKEAEALAAQERAIAEAQAVATEKAEKAEIAKVEAVAIRAAQARASQKEADETAAIAIAVAEASRKVADEEAAQRKEEAEIAKTKAVETATIAKNKEVEEARIAKEQAVKVADEKRQQAVETAEVARQKAVAEARAEEAAARATQAEAEAGQRRAEEAVTTVQETAKADRQRAVVEIKANEDAAKDKIAADRDAYVQTTAAKANADAAKEQAAAVQAEAQGRADAAKADAEGKAESIKIAAEAYAEDVTARATADADAADKQADAKIKLAAATLKEGEADAEARRLMVVANNQVSMAVIGRDIVIAAINSNLIPNTVKEFMEPMKDVAGQVQVLQIHGMGGGDGEGDSAAQAIMGAGLALSGGLPVIKQAVASFAGNEDVKDIAGVLTGVAKSALKDSAAAIREGVEGPANGAPAK